VDELVITYDVCVVRGRDGTQEELVPRRDRRERGSCWVLAHLRGIGMEAERRDGIAVTAGAMTKLIPRVRGECIATLPASLRETLPQPLPSPVLQSKEYSR
jgi:hypothetical protein